MMRWLLIPLLLSLAACSKTTTLPVKSPSVSMEVCDAVYDHILDIAVKTTIDTTDSLSTADRAVAKKMIAHEEANQGTSYKFYSSCLTSMTFAQAKCALDATTLNGITNCMRFQHGK